MKQRTPIEISDETRSKARELARQISVAQDLDPEIQEELYGHIEDKLLAYMSGEEAVTDEDAFILVREHFGDVANIKSELAQVHQHAAGQSLLRKILVAAIATMLSAQFVLWMAYTVHVGWEAVTGEALLPHRGLDGVITAAGLLLPWPVLARWKRRAAAGKSVWYAEWTTRSLGLFAAGAFGLSLIVPVAHPSSPLFGAQAAPYMLHQLFNHTMMAENFLDFQRGKLLGTAFFLLSNGVLFLALYGGMRRLTTAVTRRYPKAASITVPLLWGVAVILLYQANVTVLALLRDDAGAALATAITLPGILTRISLLLVPLAACFSWIWWCDTTPRLHRTALKAGLAWAALILLHALFPYLYLGVTFSPDSALPQTGVLWGQWTLLAEQAQFSVGREANIRYFIPHLSTAALYLLSFVAIATSLLGRTRSHGPSLKPNTAQNG